MPYIVPPLVGADIENNPWKESKSKSDLLSAVHLVKDIQRMYSPSVNLN